MDAQKPCLEAYAVNELFRLGFDVDSASVLADDYLYLVLGGLDFVAAHGESNLRDRLLRGLEKGAIDNLCDSLAKQKNNVARVTRAQLAKKPEIFVPRLVDHYPVMDKQPIIIDWDDPSMGYVAVATFAGGLKAIDFDLEQRRASTLRALQSRAKKYNEQFNFKNKS